MKKTHLLFVGLAFLTFKNQAQTTVTDYDGNVYNTVTIGTQVWMKENLMVTHYRNGNAIPNVTNGSTWNNLTTGARCYYNNDSVTNKSVYGALYNWYSVVDNRNICPTGWHVPSDGEWNIMEKYLDASVDITDTLFVGTDIGGILKEIGTTHWDSPNTGATNSSGFKALPGGIRYDDGTYDMIKGWGVWWSLTAYDALFSWVRYLTFDSTKIDRYYHYKTFGSSIRCVSDEAAHINKTKGEIQLEIYPNPALDKVYINCADNQELKMQVYNILGCCVLQSDLIGGTNVIDISPLTTGVYVVRLIGADETFLQKLIKN